MDVYKQTVFIGVLFVIFMYLNTSIALVSEKKDNISIVLLGVFNIIIAIFTAISSVAIYYKWLIPV